MSGSQELFNLKNEEKKLLEKELVEFQNSNSEIAKEYSEIRRKHDDLLQKNINLCKENCDLKKEIFELRTMNVDIKEALELLEHSEKFAKDSEAKCEELLEDLCNFTSSCRGKESFTYPKMEDCEEKRKEWASKIADIENKIAEGEKSNQEEIPKKEAEIQEMMAKIKKYVQRKVEAENEIIQLSGYCEDMKKTIETKTKEILELQNYKAKLQSRMAPFEITSKQNSKHK